MFNRSIILLGFLSANTKEETDTPYKGDMYVQVDGVAMGQCSLISSTE